jgi:hypothetical protein
MYVKTAADALPFPGSHLFSGPGGAGAMMAIRRVLPKVVKKAGLPFGRKGDGITFHTYA